MKARQSAAEAELAAAAEVARRVCVARFGRLDGHDAAQDVMERVCRRVRPLDDTAAGQHDARAELESVRGYTAFLAGRYTPRYLRPRAVPVGVGDHIERFAGVDPGPTPEQRVVRLEDISAAYRQVAGLLAGLTERERQVLVASELGRRPTGETAAELGLTPSGVRSAQTRAMARMREAVGVASPNPLASNRPVQQRARDAAAVRAAARGVQVPSQRRRLPAEVREAGRSAAAAGASVDELARRFRVSEATATRWRRGDTRSAAPETTAVDRRADSAPSADELRSRVQEAARAVAEICPWTAGLRSGADAPHGTTNDYLNHDDATSSWRPDYCDEIGATAYDADDDSGMNVAIGGAW